MVRQNDGSPAIGDTVLAYDARGNRTSDDNTSTLTNDRRDYTYDARHNVINVHGKYFTAGVWHDYDVASAFDAQNRRVFKSFLDNATLVQAQWFFYYDAMDRLIEVRYTPNVASPSTYSLFQLFWLRDRLVLYWQTDYPSVTTTRRYVGTDETGRPLDMWTWPSSGNGSRIWAVDPTAWGIDTNKVGPTVFQPFLLIGQYSDPEVAALENDGTTVHRAGVALTGLRTYDPITGGFLQHDPIADQTRSVYGYADSNPVGSADPTGLEICPITACGPGGDGTTPIDTGGDSGCGTFCRAACWANAGWAFGCACSECNPPPTPEEECARRGQFCNITEVDGVDECICPPPPPPPGSGEDSPQPEPEPDPGIAPSHTREKWCRGLGAATVTLVTWGGIAWACYKKGASKSDCIYLGGAAALVTLPLGAALGAALCGLPVSSSKCPAGQIEDGNSCKCPSGKHGDPWGSGKCIAGR
jgi:RHS repeat-associated protein